MPTTQREIAWKMLDALRDSFIAGSIAPITYGDAARAAGVEPANYGRAVGQAAALVDAACFWAKLPFLAAAYVRYDDGKLNHTSFEDGPAGQWARHRSALIDAAIQRQWSYEDIEKVRRALSSIDAGAQAAWRTIAERCGDEAVTRAYTYAGLNRQTDPY
jgi:hypothetical protein